MDTEDDSVSAIRALSRDSLKLNRRFRRCEESDFRRHIEHKSITMEDMTSIAEKLKSKCSISVSELQALKNGLVEHPTAVEVVLGTHGALRGLVRELTGSEAGRQCEAAACLCNLSAGGGRAAAAVASAAAVYLIAHTHSLTEQLALTCAWCVGTMCRSTHTAALLSRQGALPALCALLARGRGRGGEGDLTPAAGYALLHLSYQLKDGLGADHLAMILEVLHKTDLIPITSELIFVLSCHKDFALSQELLLKILEHLTKCIENNLKCGNTVKVTSSSEIVYLIRTLANLPLCDDIYTILVSEMLNLSDYFKVLLNCNTEDSLKHSLFWLLGNLYNYNRNHELFIKVIN